jgi:hypothetical protein
VGKQLGVQVAIMSEKHIMGIAWFDPEEYDELRAAFVDGDKLHDTYQEWLESAESVFEQVQQAGHRAERVPIHLAQFRGWCQLKGLPMNAGARSRYAREVVEMEAPGTDEYI